MAALYTVAAVSGAGSTEKSNSTLLTNAFHKEYIQKLIEKFVSWARLLAMSNKQLYWK